MKQGQLEEFGSHTSQHTQINWPDIIFPFNLTFEENSEGHAHLMLHLEMTESKILFKIWLKHLSHHH